MIIQREEDLILNKKNYKKIVYPIFLSLNKPLYFIEDSISLLNYNTEEIHKNSDYIYYLINELTEDWDFSEELKLKTFQIILFKDLTNFVIKNSGFEDERILNKFKKDYLKIFRVVSPNLDLLYSNLLDFNEEEEIITKLAEFQNNFEIKESLSLYNKWLDDLLIDFKFGSSGIYELIKEKSQIIKEDLTLYYAKEALIDIELTNIEKDPKKFIKKSLYDKKNNFGKILNLLFVNILYPYFLISEEELLNVISNILGLDSEVYEKKALDLLNLSKNTTILFIKKLEINDIKHLIKKSGLNKTDKESLLSLETNLKKKEKSLSDSKREVINLINNMINPFI